MALLQAGYHLIYNLGTLRREKLQLGSKQVQKVIMGGVRSLVKFQLFISKHSILAKRSVAKDKTSVLPLRIIQVILLAMRMKSYQDGENILKIFFSMQSMPPTMTYMNRYVSGKKCLEQER